MGGDSLSNSLQLTARVLAEILAGRNLADALAVVLPAGVAPGTRGAVMDLAYGTLRGFGRGDFLLGRLVDRMPGDTAARCLLLAAIHAADARLYAEHTLVSQAVDAAGRLVPRYKGLCNAVLRRFMRERDALVAGVADDQVARWQHPGWWIERLRKDHAEGWQAILAAGNTRPPMALRVNVRKTSVAQYLARLAQAGIAATPLDAGGEASDAAPILLPNPVPVDRLPDFSQGACSVQDAGAQRAALLLDPAPGMRVLDACAAPGGKAAHLLERGDVQLLALDLDPRRCRRIAENFQRLGLQGVIRAADCCKPETWWDGVPFDRILADVPCSASGVVRRHPDAKWLRRSVDIDGFGHTQGRILEALWPTLAPGGRLLYATCSVFRQENQDVMAAFRARHRDCVPVAQAGADDLAVLPTATHDGFYYALLEKRADGVDTPPG